jgi:hypothetical protein
MTSFALEFDPPPEPVPLLAESGAVALEAPAETVRQTAPIGRPGCLGAEQLAEVLGEAAEAAACQAADGRGRGREYEYCRGGFAEGRVEARGLAASLYNVIAVRYQGCAHLSLLWLA